MQKGSNEHETSEAAMVLVNIRLHHDTSKACKVPYTCLSVNYYLNLEEIIIQLKFFVFWARLRGSEGARGGGGADLWPSQTRAILNEIHRLKG